MKKEAHTNGRAKSHFSATLRKLGALSSLKAMQKETSMEEATASREFLWKKAGRDTSRSQRTSHAGPPQLLRHVVVRP